VAEPLQYSSDFGHSFKMKISEISLYFNGLRFHLSILPKSNYLPLCCLTGLAYVDLRNLYPHHIGMTADGRKYIREKRAKTNNEAFIPLHPIAEQIMSLYNTADDSKPVFPLSSRDSMWFEFHSLGVALGINENLTAHVARHTFGVNMVTSGISMESIAKMMGHSNLRSTQVYAVITDDKISKDMDKLMQRRETKETDQNKNKEDGK
ncbi:site-specific integrase, partial [Phocaeicola coprocola]|uniref:site-specific integrase n=1 Tax=Phocaeicola coprocola TaxID=310298 RepID=UPI003FD8024F